MCARDARINDIFSRTCVPQALALPQAMVRYDVGTSRWIGL
jgi:hypothetical protein